MGAMGRLFERALPLEGPYPLTSSRLIEVLGGRPSVAGPQVNEARAMAIPAVYSCIRVLADSVAALPLLVYRRLGRGKERAVDHPLYRVLHQEPNAWMTPYQLKELVMVHANMWGNFYANIERDRFGDVVALWPLRPQDMIDIKVSSSGDLAYLYRLPTGETRTLAQREVLHIRGVSPDGIRGYSPIQLFRESLGLTVAAEEFGARFFGNQARPGGVLQSKSRLSADAASRLKASWESAHSGLSNAHRVAVLEEGVEWKQISLPPNDAQFLETRNFQLTEFCRIFRVPPHKISDLNRATYSNVDKQEQQFKGDSLEPWLVRTEEGMSLSLLSRPERSEFFIEFLMDAQWRADIATRYGAYSMGRQWGWLSANDIRELENMNPIDGGDDYWQPANMMTVGEEPAQVDSSAARYLSRHELDGLLRRAIEAARGEAEEDTWEVIAADAERMRASAPLALPPPMRVRRSVERDADGRIAAVVEEPIS